jgi:hypothetical protein
VSVHPLLSAAPVPLSPLFVDGDMPDLAPEIYRQRLVIEGQCPQPVSAAAIGAYLLELSSVCDMTPLLDPVTHRSDQYGWAGWIHWENSGAHFYAWEKPLLFFSVDIYTCKAFEAQRAIAFTTGFFSAGPVVAKAF